MYYETAGSRDVDTNHERPITVARAQTSGGSAYPLAYRHSPRRSIRVSPRFNVQPVALVLKFRHYRTDFLRRQLNVFGDEPRFEVTLAHLHLVLQVGCDDLLIRGGGVGLGSGSHDTVLLMVTIS